jgi:transcriptional regulator with XRE-family HTH domain
MRASEVTRSEEAFGARVREARRRVGLSQAEVARLASVSRRAIVNLEAGAGSSLATIVRVLDAIGRSDWLLSLEAPEPEFNPLDLLEPPGGARASSRRRTRPAGSSAP